MRLLKAILLVVLLAGAAVAQAPVKPTDVINPRLLAQALKGPLAEAEEIVVAVRDPGDPRVEPHWYANFGYYAFNAERKAYREGARLCRVNVRTGKVTVLLEDPRGGIRDPQVHYDAQKILFSYRKGGTDYYHLYEIGVDGRGLKELTTGPWDDIEPTYTAGGDIVFASSRGRRWVSCWKTQVAILYKCHADGSGLRPISGNIEQDNTPWPLPDGRILYTRWEYIDRSQVHYHHLWTSNPDGTQQNIFFGNLHPGIVMIDAKPVPGSRKVVASFSPGHGRYEHNGMIALVDPSAGPDAQSSVRYIHKQANFRDPWAFSEELFLAARGPALVLLDASGALQEIYRLPAQDIASRMEIHEPRPLVRRPRERLVAAHVNLAENAGTVILSDVYKGRNMSGVRPGEIKKLLVLEPLPTPVHYIGGMQPISYSGTFTLERVVGTVPVEADGSAYFRLPALRSFLFVALDENDRSVKRMQSFMTVQPGETVSCVGCHEDRVEAPRNPTPVRLALRRPPSEIEPIRDAPEVFDFPRDIQPILNRRCLPCHDYEQRKGGVILTGDRGPIYSHSYFTLSIRHQIADGQNRPHSNYPPRSIGSSASPLMRKLEPSHHGVTVTPHERKLIRLWIESAAPYPGTYAALGTGMIGGESEDGSPQRKGEWRAMKAGMDAIEQRCGSCHAGARTLPASIFMEARVPEQPKPPIPGYPRPYGEQAAVLQRYSRHIVYNLTRPEKSLLLLAPLTREQGGYGSCGAPVFEGESDPAYQAILAAIREAKQNLEEIQRFDMPGFRPRADYIREMKRYGVLPPSHQPSDPIDYYALDRRYWESLWWRPEAH